MVRDAKRDAKKELVRRRFEELDKGNLDIIDELFAPNYTLHFPGVAKPMTREETKGFFKTLYSALPDLRHHLEEQLSEGDKVVTRWTARGTHTGKALFGVSATGQQVTLTGINIYRIADGKLAESHVNWDMLGLLEQFGLISTPWMRGPALIS